MGVCEVKTMSKLIVEMEMPLNCEHCPMSHWNKLNELTGCDAVGGKRYVSSEDEFWCVPRPSWCPIIGELPEQHGRLIDASTVLFDAEDSEGVAPPMPVTVDDYLVLFDLPTIVPATERSET